MWFIENYLLTLKKIVRSELRELCDFHLSVLSEPKKGSVDMKILRGHVWPTDFHPAVIITDSANASILYAPWILRASDGDSEEMSHVPSFIDYKNPWIIARVLCSAIHRSKLFRNTTRHLDLD